MAAIIKTVEELGRKEYVIPLEKGIDAVIVGYIMLGIHPVDVHPGLDDRAGLNIMFWIIRQEVEIKSAFVSVCPQDHGWMVHILFDQFFHQLPPGRSIVRRILP